MSPLLGPRRASAPCRLSTRQRPSTRTHQIQRRWQGRISCYGEISLNISGTSIFSDSVRRRPLNRPFRRHVVDDATFSPVKRKGRKNAQYWQGSSIDDLKTRPISFRNILLPDAQGHGPEWLSISHSFIFNPHRLARLPLTTRLWRLDHFPQKDRHSPHETVAVIDILGQVSRRQAVRIRPNF